MSDPDRIKKFIDQGTILLKLVKQRPELWSAPAMEEFTKLAYEVTGDAKKYPTSGSKPGWGRRKKGSSRRPEGTMLQLTDGTPQNHGRDPTMYFPGQNQGRDPTMYVPGQEDRPDPESTILAIENGEPGRTYYAEDPPVKPKRDPSVYVEGNYALEDPPLKPKRDPTMYVEGRADASVYTMGKEDPSVYSENRRDPTMYVDEASAAESAAFSAVRAQRDPTMYVDGAGSADPYEMGGIANSEAGYDQFGFRHADEADEEYARGAREPSNYAEEDSFQTREVSVRSGRPKQSRKGKKSSRSGSRK